MSCLNLNKVVLAGRLTADPELKQTTSGISVTSFTLAVNRKYAKDQEQQQTDFISVVAWRQTAEFISRYFKKALHSASPAQSKRALGRISRGRNGTLPRLLRTRQCSWIASLIANRMAQTMAHRDMYPMPTLPLLLQSLRKSTPTTICRSEMGCSKWQQANDTIG